MYFRRLNCCLAAHFRLYKGLHWIQPSCFGVIAELSRQKISLSKQGIVCSVVMFALLAAAAEGSGSSTVEDNQ